MRGRISAGRLFDIRSPWGRAECASGAIGATAELYRPVVDDEYDMAGTFNGNPLTMAASRAALTEVLTREVYGHLDELHSTLAAGSTRQ